MFADLKAFVSVITMDNPYLSLLGAVVCVGLAVFMYRKFMRPKK